MTLKEWLDSQRKRKRGNGPASRGTQSWLAARLRCEQALVSKWVRRLTTPTAYAERIVRLSGGNVTMEELLSERDWAKSLVGRVVVVIGIEYAGQRTVKHTVNATGGVRLSAPVAGLYDWHSLELRVVS